MALAGKAKSLSRECECYFIFDWRMVNTSLGKFLRVNRSIQAEGTFAMTKEDMNFRRFLLRSTVKVDAEWTILAMAYNILKLCHKLLTGRLGTHLAVPSSFPAGL